MAMNIGRYNRDSSTSDWVDGIHSRPRPPPSSSDYADALSARSEFTSAAVREAEWKRQSAGLGATADKDYLVGHNLGGRPGDRSHAVFVKESKKVPAGSVELPRNPLDFVPPRDTSILRKPMDIYDPVHQTYTYAAADDAGSLARRDLRLRPWSLAYPERPIARLDDLPAKADHLNSLMRHGEVERRSIAGSSVDGDSLASEVTRPRKTNASNVSEKVSRVLSGKDSPPDGTSSSLPRGKVRQERGAYNNVYQRFYSEDVNKLEETRLASAAISDIKHAKERAISLESEYDVITLTHKKTGRVAETEPPKLKDYNNSDIFFRGPATSIDPIDSKLNLATRERNPVLESTLPASMPRVIKMRERNPIVEGLALDTRTDFAPISPRRPSRELRNPKLSGTGGTDSEGIRRSEAMVASGGMSGGDMMRKSLEPLDRTAMRAAVERISPLTTAVIPTPSGPPPRGGRSLRPIDSTAVEGMEYVTPTRPVPKSSVAGGYAPRRPPSEAPRPVAGQPLSARRRSFKPA